MNVDWSKLEQTIEEWLHRHDVPGISLTVVSGEQPVYTGCFGYKDVENNLKPDAETRYACASVTKAMTATALGILKDEGKIDWRTPVRTYLPGFAMYDGYATANLTLADMLSHNSGLPRHDFSWFNNLEADRPTSEYVARLAHLKPNKGFRTQYEYNNFMFTAAGAVVEAVSGMPWGEFLTKRIFTPLGMKDTTYTISGLKDAANRALPYGKKDGKPKRLEYRNFDGMAGCGTVNSTVKDMAAWISMNINGGIHMGTRIISQATLSEIHTQRNAVPPLPGGFNPHMPLAAYAFGWSVQPYRGRLCLNHSGGIDGFTSYATFMPEEKYGIMLFCNQGGSNMPFAVAAHIFDQLLGTADGIDWADFYKKRSDAMMAAAPGPSEAIRAARAPETAVNRPVSQLAGTYSHKGYGEVEITADKDALTLHYNGWAMPLAHNNYETFEFNYADGEGLMTVTFVPDAKGAIACLSIPIEPSLGEPISFVKN